MFFSSITLKPREKLRIFCDEENRLPPGIRTDGQTKRAKNPLHGLWHKRVTAARNYRKNREAIFQDSSFLLLGKRPRFCLIQVLIADFYELLCCNSSAVKVKLAHSRICTEHYTLNSCGKSSDARSQISYPIRQIGVIFFNQPRPIKIAVGANGEGREEEITRAVHVKL